MSPSDLPAEHTRRMTRLGVAVLLVIGLAGVSRAEAVYDVVIRGGKVLDGAGNPWIEADIAIQDGKLAKIGRIEESGGREIDATGKYVAPGWIDMMDQSGSVLREVGLAPNKIGMGVTTVISGEAGTPVPAAEIGAYFSELEQKGISVNFATYYSAAQARVAVLGHGNADPTPDQLDTMKALVAEAMEAGAMGITTALIYPPSAYQKTENLVELAKVVAGYEGLYASHIRDESADFLAAVSEAIHIGEASGAGVEIFHLKAAFYPNWNSDMKKALALIEAARSRSVNVAANLYPYLAGGTGLDVSVPSWVYADGHEKALERLRDPEVRTRMKKELAAGPMPGWTNLVYASGGWKNVILANAQVEEYAKFHGQSLADTGTALGRDPADIAWDLIDVAYPRRPVALYFMMSEADVQAALQAPWTSIGSDAAAAREQGAVDALGLPHPRSYGTFPKVIAEYVRENETLTLPEAIRKMTSWPAARMGLMDRGVLREGLAADIVVFDLQDIDPVASWENPTAKPAGIEHVLVNGQLVLDNGRHTGATPGKVLRGPGLKR